MAQLFPPDWAEMPIKVTYQNPGLEYDENMVCEDFLNMGMLPLEVRAATRNVQLSFGSVAISYSNHQKDRTVVHHYFPHIFVWGSCFWLWTFTLRGRCGTWRHWLPFAWQAWHLWHWAGSVALRHTPSLTHHLSHTTLSHTFTHHLSHTITDHLSPHHLSHTTLSHTIFRDTIFHSPLCHTPSLTHHLSHTVTDHLSHTIFHIPLCHTPSFTTPSFTHNFVTHHFSRHHLSLTTLSHTIFNTQLCHTLSFTHNFRTHTHTIFHT